MKKGLKVLDKRRDGEGVDDKLRHNRKKEDGSEVEREDQKNKRRRWLILTSE